MHLGNQQAEDDQTLNAYLNRHVNFGCAVDLRMHFHMATRVKVPTQLILFLDQMLFMSD